MMAQLVRFYGIDPFKYPAWFLDVLYKCITPIRAEEATWTANAHRVAQADRQSYTRAIGKWHKAAETIEQRYEKSVVTIDPRFERWYKDNGIPYRLAAAKK